MTRKLTDAHSPDRTNQRRVPEERGPFGRPTTRRGASRSKTFTPVGKKEDKDAVENWRAIDDVFNKAKQESGTVQVGNGTGPQAAAPSGVPSEVILYGFPEPYQYSAVEFFERVSGGIIYEDYDRLPPNTRFNLTLSRSEGARTGKIPADALRKVNRYHGGEHWIKVTFDSAEAADRACYYSPHTLHGHIIYAERYRGEGPVRDEAIPATRERLASVRSSPSQTTSSSTLQPASTATASSSTVQPVTQQPIPMTSLRRSVLTPSSAVRQRNTQLIQGASRAVLLPAESALLPASSRWQQTFGAWPIIGFFFGGPSHDMIGNELPRKEDGTFDWDNASLYWWFWALLDSWFFFANFLGLKGDD
jgi:hypothetical protein